MHCWGTERVKSLLGCSAVLRLFPLPSNKLRKGRTRRRGRRPRSWRACLPSRSIWLRKRDCRPAGSCCYENQKGLRSILYFQKANEISLLCCVSMWNFRADFDWKFFPHSPQGDSTGFVSPSFGWASFKCWFICKKIMRVNLARKVISSVMKIHLRHRAHDVPASQAKECRVCVPGR